MAAFRVVSRIALAGARRTGALTPVIARAVLPVATRRAAGAVAGALALGGASLAVACADGGGGTDYGGISAAVRGAPPGWGVRVTASGGAAAD